MVSINRFGGKCKEVFGFSATFMAGKKLGQYFSIKAFVQNNCGLNKSLKDAKNSSSSMIFKLLTSDLCQIFMEIILTSTNVDAVSNQ